MNTSKKIFGRNYFSENEASFDEKVYIGKNNELIFGHNKKPKDKQETQSFKGSFKPYMDKSKDLFGTTVYCVYKMSGMTLNDISKALEKQSVTTSGKGCYEEFLRRTVVHLNKVLETADIILISQTSSALIKDLSEKFHESQPHLKVIWESFTKNTIEDLKDDYEKYEIDEETKKSLEKIIEKTEENGVLELNRVPKPLAKIITNFLRLDYRKARPEYIKDSDVIILDDLSDSGYTMEEMIKNIKLFDPKSITGIQLFAI